MILRSTNPLMAEDEKKIIDWFTDHFGEEDTLVFTRWVWDRHRNAPQYVEALWFIAEQTRKEGPPFFQNLLEVARYPKEMREATDQIASTMMPIVERLKTKALGFRNDPKVLNEIFEELRLALREKIRDMWPEKHRATIDGAMVVSVKRNLVGQSFIDFRTLAKALFEKDPLANTAESSHV